MIDTNHTVKKLAGLFIERCAHLGYSGKKRDQLALEFFVGASTALTGINHPDGQCVLNVTAMLIATRGYGEVVRLASDDERRAAA